MNTYDMTRYGHTGIKKEPDGLYILVTGLSCNQAVNKRNVLYSRKKSSVIACLKRILTTNNNI